LTKGVVGLKKIYVGNLAFSMSDQDLMALFTEYGVVNSATIVLDRNTGRSRGFGFVEMEDDNAAVAAIEALNGREIEGRTLNVNEARPREPRGRSRW
jgi:RNA recognition motif-containing protein